jgi:nucleoside-diphosphate-sugar epimerase
MKILITGANGFVGRVLCAEAAMRKFSVRAATRRNPDFTECIEKITICGVDGSTNWRNALDSCDVVVHLAARVHVMKEVVADPSFEFRQVNVDGTLNLARQAVQAGVRRFILISSIKVNGEFTDLGHPFIADQIPAPSDPYGVSKYEAEIGLMALSEETGMELVIIRSPLVYGPGVKANFLSMMNWLQRGIPLPLGGVTKNHRSFVYLDNLVDLIITCIDHPAAANQTFLVSDDEDLSTAELLERMALALGKRSKLISVPAGLITLGAKLVGRDDIAQRLCGSLQVDIKKTKDLLGWSPPVSVNEGLRQTAALFLKMRS